MKLQNNQLSGEIPSEIGNLINLGFLNLENNQLSGEIPSEIGNLINLNTLKLKNNQLTGEIPQAVCDLIESNNLNISYILDGNNLTNTCDDGDGGGDYGTYYSDISSPEECEAYAYENGYNWDGIFCDADNHGIEPGCYQVGSNVFEWQDNDESLCD